MIVKLGSVPPGGGYAIVKYHPKNDKRPASVSVEHVATSDDVESSDRPTAQNVFDKQAQLIIGKLRSDYADARNIEKKTAERAALMEIEIQVLILIMNKLFGDFINVLRFHTGSEGEVGRGHAAREKAATELSVYRHRPRTSIG